MKLMRIRREDYLPAIKDSDYYKPHPAMPYCSADKKIKKWKANQHRIKGLGSNLCPQCNGSGKSGFLWFSCGACSGKGTVPVIVCPECSGKGTVNGFFCKKECKMCKGLGKGLFY